MCNLYSMTTTHEAMRQVGDALKIVATGEKEDSTPDTLAPASQEEDKPVTPELPL
jgi:hypothetical protein